ncbi:MAG: NAD(+) kinase, partial [Acutalibacteraceae bacterium]|nr:NAD(+) kinase [Acutalibacteraceae bacterium]
ITPICSHSLSAKPILLGANNLLRVKAFSKKRTDIYLTVDGRKVAPLKPYTEVQIKRSPKFAQMIRLNDRSFYKTLSYKFKDARSM